MWCPCIVVSIVAGIVRRCIIAIGDGSGFGLYGGLDHLVIFGSVDVLSEIGDGSRVDVGVTSAVLCCEKMMMLSSSLQVRRCCQRLWLSLFSKQVGNSGRRVLLAGVSAVLLSLPLGLSLTTVLSSSLIVLSKTSAFTFSQVDSLRGHIFLISTSVSVGGSVVEFAFVFEEL